MGRPLPHTAEKLEMTSVSILVQVLLEALSKIRYQSPFDAPDFVGIAQGEQVLCSS
jgi:hypothetical protein